VRTRRLVGKDHGRDSSASEGMGRCAVYRLPKNLKLPTIPGTSAARSPTRVPAQNWLSPCPEWVDLGQGDDWMLSQVGTRFGGLPFGPHLTVQII